MPKNVKETCDPPFPIYALFLLNYRKMPQALSIFCKKKGLLFFVYIFCFFFCLFFNYSLCVLDSAVSGTARVIMLFLLLFYAA